MGSINIYFAGAILSAAVYVVTSMVMAHQLGQWGVKINYFLIRLLIPRYAHQYRSMSREKTGGTGWPFYGWVISINLALIFFILGLVITS
jgi:hypothetical protein